MELMSFFCWIYICFVLVIAPNPGDVDKKDEGFHFMNVEETEEGENKGKDSDCNLGTSLLLVDDNSNNTFKHQEILGSSLAMINSTTIRNDSEEADALGSSLLLINDIKYQDKAHTSLPKKQKMDQYDFSEEIEVDFSTPPTFIRTSTPKKLPINQQEESDPNILEASDIHISIDDDCSEQDIVDDKMTSLIPKPTLFKTKKTESYQTSNSKLKRILNSVDECTLKRNICRKKCISSLSIKGIQDMRYRYWTKNYQQRVEWFSDRYLDAEIANGKPQFMIGKGVVVCGKCFRTLYRINKNFYYKWIPKFEQGSVSSGYRKGREPSKYLEDAKLWLEEYGKYRGDFMPDRLVTLLPYKTRKIDVYKCYADEMTKDWKCSVSRSSFYKMWNVHHTYLKIKKSNSFSRCQTCTTLTRRLEATRASSDREEIKALILAHNNRQMSERAYYRTKRKQAEENKRGFLSIIIDGMDQSKTNLPHFTGRKSKALDQANLLPTHVQGIINHGLKRFATYVDINEYSHDPNLVMNTILQELYETSKAMNNYLPQVLYIQADNCFRENKNRFMMAFAELLVRKNIFKEVHLSFLMVGHTHEDIDAQFAKVSETLRKKDAETMVQFMNLLPNSRLTNGLYNIKAWLDNCISPFSGQSGPLHFRFSRDQTNTVIGEYKGLHYRPWIKMSKPILKTTPTGIPKVLQPNFQKHNIDFLEKNIIKCKYLFSDIVSETQYRWWQRYITFLKEIKCNEGKANNYAKKNARWILPLLPKQQDQLTTLQTNIPMEVREMIDKEIDDPKVKRQIDTNWASQCQKCKGQHKNQ